MFNLDIKNGLLIFSFAFFSLSFVGQEGKANRCCKTEIMCNVLSTVPPNFRHIGKLEGVLAETIPMAGNSQDCKLRDDSQLTDQCKARYSECVDTPTQKCNAWPASGNLFVPNSC